MDADEEAMREHKLAKARKHLKELDEKYHALKKKYDALLHIESEFHHMEEELAMWKDKYKHMDEECHMWEEKYHKMEAKYHDAYSKIAIHMKRIKELEHSVEGHDHVI